MMAGGTNIPSVLSKTFQSGVDMPYTLSKTIWFCFVHVYQSLMTIFPCENTAAVVVSPDDTAPFIHETEAQKGKELPPEQLGAKHHIADQSTQAWKLLGLQEQRARMIDTPGHFHVFCPACRLSYTLIPCNLA
jgi:hypothetical protein